jgi:hypothetical protein
MAVWLIMYHAASVYAGVSGVGWSVPAFWKEWQVVADVVRGVRKTLLRHSAISWQLQRLPEHQKALNILRLVPRTSLQQAPAATAEGQEPFRFVHPL